MFKIALVAITAIYFVVPAHASTLPPVNTNVVNANKAAFVGSMITAQTSTLATQTIRQAVTPIVVEFRTISACETWISNIGSSTPGLVAKFAGNANGYGSVKLAADWEKYGYVAYIGGCVDITNGSVSLPQ